MNFSASADFHPGEDLGSVVDDSLKEYTLDSDLGQMKEIVADEIEDALKFFGEDRSVSVNVEMQGDTFRSSSKVIETVEREIPNTAVEKDVPLNLTLTDVGAQPPEPVEEKKSSKK